jgi:hypothetical protein
MRRFRAFIVLSAMVAGMLAGFVGGAAPAQARVNGFMTCKINLLTDGSDSPPSGRIIECYY